MLTSLYVNLCRHKISFSSKIFSLKGANKLWRPKCSKIGSLCCWFGLSLNQSCKKSSEFASWVKKKGEGSSSDSLKCCLWKSIRNNQEQEMRQSKTENILQLRKEAVQTCSRSNKLGFTLQVRINRDNFFQVV